MRPNNRIHLLSTIYYKTCLIPTGSKSEMEIYPNEYLSETNVNADVGRLFYRGTTFDMVEGLSLAREILTEEAYMIAVGIPKTILVISAGSSDNPDQVLAEADLIRREMIRVISVAIGLKVSRSILQSILEPITKTIDFIVYLLQNNFIV